MITVLYEDSDVIVVEKPAGVESQSARGFEPDMVSRIRTHIHKLSPTPSPKSTNHPPYVGVIHNFRTAISLIFQQIIHIGPLVIHRFSTNHGGINFPHFSLLNLSA